MIPQNMYDEELPQDDVAPQDGMSQDEDMSNDSDLENDMTLATPDEGLPDFGLEGEGEPSGDLESDKEVNVNDEGDAAEALAHKILSMVKDAGEDAQEVINIMDELTKEDESGGNYAGLDILDDSSLSSEEAGEEGLQGEEGLGEEELEFGGEESGEEDLGFGGEENLSSDLQLDDDITENDLPR